jgi:hypothetical protein
METAKGLTLYLAPWQVRMAKDFLPAKTRRFTKVVISRIIDKKHWVTYRVPVLGLSKKNWNLYLTDEQQLIVRANFGLKSNVNCLNITEEQIVKGGVAFVQ